MRTETLPAWRPRCRLSAGGCSPAASGRPAERREETVQSFRPELVVTDYTAGKTERRKENLLHWLEVRTADLTNECQRLRVLDPHDSFDVSLFFRDQNSKKKKIIKKQLQFCYISNGNVDLSNSSNDLLPR